MYTKDGLGFFSQIWAQKWAHKLVMLLVFLDHY